MRVPLLCVLLAACGRRPATTPIPPPVDLRSDDPTAAAVQACPDPSPDAADNARCPDPEAWVRGDGIGTSEKLGAPRTGHPLPEWDIAHLLGFGCAYACPEEGAEARLLMWSVVEDSRPLRNHYAFVLVHDKNRPKERWVLVDMYRHATNRSWNPHKGSIHDRSDPIQTFAQPPTAAEIDAMLERDGWQWEDEERFDGEATVPGFLVKAGNVLDTVWAEVLEPPTRTFLPGIEFPGA